MSMDRLSTFTLRADPGDLLPSADELAGADAAI
jgi:hypothetical protein